MQDEILIKYLLGEAEVEEVAQVDAWLEGEVTNQQYLLKLRKIWDDSQLLEKGDSYDTEEQWQLLKGKMHQATAGSREPDYQAQVIPLKPKTRNIRWRMAAALIVCLLGSWVIFQYFTNSEAVAEQLTLTATASPVTDTLSDGSIITLNHYSRLQAPLAFKGRTREVNLEAGEAFFKVVHDAKKPFLVHSGNIEVQVLGTSFNVKSTADATFITVATGKVQVSYQGKQLVLNPLEQAVINHVSEKLSKHASTGQLYNYYVTQQFVANDTRLEDLVKVLNEAYHVNIVFSNDRLKELRLTTVFAKQPIDKILDVIAATFNIQVVHKKNSIILQ